MRGLNDTMALLKRLFEALMSVLVLSRYSVIYISM